MQTTDGPTESGNSYLATYEECPRKFLYRYGWRIVGVEQADFFGIGKLFHRGMEILHTRPIDEVVSFVKAEYTDSLKSVIGEKEEKVWAMSEKLIREYARHYEQDDLVIIITEFEFAIPITDPQTGQVYSYTGRIDGVGELKGMPGAFFIVERKTSGEPPQTFLQRFSVNMAVTGYFLGAQQQKLPGPLAGVLLDAVFKPRFGKSGDIGEMSEKNFVREPYFRQPEDFEAFLRDTASVFREIEELKRTSLNKPEAWRQRGMRTGACYGRYGSPCEYLEICKSYMDPRVIEGMFKVVEDKEEVIDGGE